MSIVSGLIIICVIAVLVGYVLRRRKVQHRRLLPQRNNDVTTADIERQEQSQQLIRRMTVFSENKNYCPLAGIKTELRDATITILLPEQVSLAELIGEGAFGNVYKGIYSRRVLFAPFENKPCKCMKKHITQRPSAEDGLERPIKQTLHSLFRTPV